MKMGNKKKRTTEAALNGNHCVDIISRSHDRTIAVVQSNIQSADESVETEIKQEEDIKQETVHVGELVDVPTLQHMNTNQAVELNERNAENDFDHVSMDEVKAELKKVCDEKREEEPRKNTDSGEEVTDDQPNQQPRSPDEEDPLLPERDIAKNTQNFSGDCTGNQMKAHKCNFCEYHAPFKSHLNRHMLKHTGEKPHGCDLCPKRFTQKGCLRTHMKVHIEEMLFHCSGCLQGFNGKDEKMAHEIKCKIRRYECHLCKESFGSMKAHIIRHMRMHSGNKPFECEECFKQFTEKGNLIKHIKFHSGPRSFRCSKCREGFRQQDERDAHEEKCSRRVYECHICGKSVGLNKSNLVSHMRTHSGVKLFECKKCQKKYTQKAHLKLHMETHTKNLQFKCLVCRQGFAKDDKRKAHQRNCNERNYECHLCKKFFGAYKTGLKRHMRTHSGEKPFQCKLCRNTFTTEGSRKRHMNQIHKKMC